jgi:uncharacterized protein
MDCNSCLNKEKCYSKNLEGGETFGHTNNIKSLPEITSAFLILTQQCNLSCKYCFVLQKPKAMTYQIALDATEFLARNAAKRNEIPSINYFGGEPLLKWEEIIVPLTRYIRNKYGNNFELSMTTNGVLLDEAKLEFMKQNNIGFMVSIDGDRKTQELNRPCKNGASSFDILASRIPMFLRYNPGMTFRATVDHDNVAEYFSNHKFAMDNGYNNSFFIVNVFSKWSEEEKAELKRQIHKTAEYYLELIMQGKNVTFNPFNTMFNKIKAIEEAEKNKSYRTVGEGLLAFGRCGLGASKFASVGTDGKLYSCQEMSDNDDSGKDFIIGDIYNGTDNEKRMNIINKFNPKLVHSTEGTECIRCPFNNICDGACTINNYFANGDLNIMPSILCFYYQCLYKEALAIYNLGKEYENKLSILKKRGIFNARSL